MSAWQPIATAPKRRDKSILAGWWRERWFVTTTASWVPGTPAIKSEEYPMEATEGYWSINVPGAYSEDNSIHPTHWMEIPKAPKRERGIK